MDGKDQHVLGNVLILFLFLFYLMRTFCRLGAFPRFSDTLSGHHPRWGFRFDRLNFLRGSGRRKRKRRSGGGGRGKNRKQKESRC